jgi:hypothetical protein
MVRSLLFIGLLVLVSPAGAITIGSEREVTLRRAGLATLDGQQNPDLAASATGLRLAAWSEYIGKDRRLGIVVSRIKATGATLDADGIDLGVSTVRPAFPRIASNGTDWLVAWNDAYGVYACRVSQSGQLLDDHPIFVSDWAYADESLSVVWDGNSYLVAFIEGYWFHGLHVSPTVVRVSAGGQMLKKIALTPPGNNNWISLAAGGKGSLVIGGPGAAILSRTDMIIPIALAPSESPEIVWNGRDFLVSGFVDHDTLKWQFVSGAGVAGTPFSPVAVQVWLARTTPFGDGFLLYRWFAGELSVEFRNDRGELVDSLVRIPSVRIQFANAPFRADGNMIIYARTIDDAIPDVERVFVRVIEGAPKPRRRAVR